MLDAVSPLAAKTSFWASSLMSHARKFQAWSDVLVVLGDAHGIAAEERGGLAFLGARDRGDTDSKPPSFSASNSVVEEVFGYGITPMLPLANGAVQVAPVSSLEPAPKPLVVLASSFVGVEHGLHGIVVEGGFGAICVHHGFAVSPHGREQGRTRAPPDWPAK